MDIQTIIVALIIAAALVYIGLRIRRKTKAFSSKSASCETNCGCDK